MYKLKNRFRSFLPIVLIIFVIVAILSIILYGYCSWQRLRIAEAFFSENLARFVGDNNKVGFINPQGKWVIEPIFDDAYDFMDSHSIVQYKKKWGIINSTGKYIIPPMFSTPPSYFSEGFCVVEDNAGKVGYMNLNGKWQIHPLFENGTSFSEGLAGVKQHVRWGFIDIKGNWVIHPEYLAIKRLFKDGTALVQSEDGKEIMINQVGKAIE